jgi:predicted TIM-barrel fold metal-dependent hydrolase
MPVNLHVADPIWMYQPMDGRNEGMINAYLWRLDQKKDLVDLNGMIDILAATLQRHPRTTFIACHLANLDYDLARLGALLDRHPNLYADISARFAETATIPRVAAAFFERYQDRLLYGSDMEFTPEMYQMTFRILESSDDHFYGVEQFSYLWNLYGLGLSPGTLRKIYGENARQLLHKGRSPGR